MWLQILVFSQENKSPSSIYNTGNLLQKSGYTGGELRSQTEAADKPEVSNSWKPLLNLGTKGRSSAI